jgi:hypothetical protein
MSIVIQGKSNKYTFDGPYSSTQSLEDRSGLYAIISARSTNNYLVDVGESSEVKSRVENHDRKNCWNRNLNGGSLKYAVLYTPNLRQEGRRVIEDDIRDNYDLPCGRG